MTKVATVFVLCCNIVLVVESLISNFSHENLSSFPEAMEISEKTETLILDENSISSIPSGALNHLTVLSNLQMRLNAFTVIPDLAAVTDSLTTLIMDHNPLHHLSPISGLTNLQTLSLEDTDLHSFPDGTFNALDSLEELFLFDNYLTELPDLSGVGDTLQILVLSENNVHSMDTSRWSTLVALQTFEGSRMKLKSFPDMTRTSAIATAVLSNNWIRDFPHLPNIGQTLQTLNLDSNLIQTVSADKLQHMKAIQYLSLVHNVLGEMPDIATIKGSLTDLNLSDNFLVPSAARFLDYAQLTSLNLDNMFGEVLPPLLAETPQLILSIRSERLDLCLCDHMWLKRAIEAGATVNFTDTTCMSDVPWSALTLEELYNECFLDYIGTQAGKWRPFCILH